jgi:hypothetical protein
MASSKIVIALSIVLFLNILKIETNEQLIDYYDELTSKELPTFEDLSFIKQKYENTYEKRSNPNKARVVVNEKEMVNDLVNKLKNIYVVSSRPRF